MEWRNDGQTWAAPRSLGMTLQKDQIGSTAQGTAEGPHMDDMELHTDEETWATSRNVRRTLQKDQIGPTVQKTGQKVRCNEVVSKNAGPNIDRESLMSCRGCTR
ncbi:hypothetical protein TNCT_357151 [Trichonephila clavata]|uniref:Uncharacterized protein n=1 Tax=Trichonephila clavata TaxID=2740835 RepID=A0A8X6K5K9_TRICU|nr:hypothetical protein TNCT_357151 [Trichonephila clavata]